MLPPVDPTTAVQLLDGAVVDAADSAACASLLGTAKGMRGWLDSFEARVTSRITELHATAGGAPAADLHSQCSGVFRRTRR